MDYGPAFVPVVEDHQNIPAKHNPVGTASEQVGIVKLVIDIVRDKLFCEFEYSSPQ